MTIRVDPIKVSEAASMVKLVTGVANNCALLIMLDALDQVKKHPAYRQRVKMLYGRAIEEWHDYERRLLYAEHNRFFHVEDMMASTRRHYGEHMTDKEYFEFWKGLGGKAYAESRPFVTSLWNKYRLSLINHKVDNVEPMAWALTGSACLTLAVQLYDKIIWQESKVSGIFLNIMRHIFAGFSLANVLTAWNRAMRATDPTEYDLDDVEYRNIQAGIAQLEELWSSHKLLYGSTLAAIPEYDDIFRTRQEMKNAMRNIAEARDEATALTK